MGSGTWTSSAYTTHSTVSRGFASMDEFKTASTQDLYKSRGLSDVLNPYGVTRECSDSEEHPNTIPVILALDVTGSMGDAASAIAKQLNDIMTEVYKTVKDVEFLIMGIGDLSYDSSPIQASQFESDIRIAEQTEKIYFEGGGGGNSFESYTSAWFFGVNNTKLDCWKRNKKGIIITLGDEPMNPYLPYNRLNAVMGSSVQADVETKDLYNEVTKKYDVYHVAIDDNRTCFKRYESAINASWGQLLGENLLVSNCNNLYKTIADIITKNEEHLSAEENKDGYIRW